MQDAIGKAKSEHATQRLRHLPLPTVLQPGDQVSEPPGMAAESDHAIEDSPATTACTASGSIMPPIASGTTAGAPGQHTVGQHGFVANRRP